MFITPKKVPSQYQGNSWDGSIPAVKEKMCKNIIYHAWNQRMQYINGLCGRVLLSYPIFTMNFPKQRANNESLKRQWHKPGWTSSLSLIIPKSENATFHGEFSPFYITGLCGKILLLFPIFTMHIPRERATNEYISNYTVTQNWCHEAIILWKMVKSHK